MKIIRSIAELKDWRKGISNSVGFVPTMGALHAGHLKLVEEAQKQCPTNIVSIFVNPTQFNNPEDLEKYPSTLEEDLSKLRRIGVDAVFIPNTAEIYFDDFRFKAIEEDYSLKLCGKNRPGHFTGVLTVLLKLFNLTKAQKVFMGEKDYQQFQLVRDFTQAIFMDIEIIPVSTVRESTGLAMSSRNMRLSATGRKTADQFAQIFSDDTLTIEKMKSKILALGIEIDYLENLNGRRFAAVIVDGIRLIDNRPITSSKETLVGNSSTSPRSQKNLGA
ncbi:pantoate--beta-alanine ligase [bacterium]|nr:pantoate--beta-alanine ligase [bacterium]